jgi:hypothetical protein
MCCVFWSEPRTLALLQAAMQCLAKANKPNTPTDVKEYLTNLYVTLSEDIHGAPWSINAVQLSDELNSLDKCFLGKLIVCMGLKDSADPR